MDVASMTPVMAAMLGMADAWLEARNAVVHSAAEADSHPINDALL